jgi:hypothetical protein
MKPRFSPLFILPIVLLGLLLGLGTGLSRMGWTMDSFSQRWLMFHGAIMLNAFLGTLISLERATALAGISKDLRWSYLVPILNAVAGIVLLFDIRLGQSLFFLSSAGMVLLFGIMLKRHPSHYVFVMALGAFLWLIGNSLWLFGQPLYLVVHSWIAFLVLTIAGERLELSRIMRLTNWQQGLLLGLIALYLLGVLLSPLDLALGIRIAGAGSIGMALWLLRYDLSRRTIRQAGLPRYIGYCLIIGYVWLGIAGAIGLWKGAVYVGLDYEALLHAYLLGFVFSMIFGHAPIILPSLTQWKYPYHGILFVHLILLHLSLLLRLYGDLAVNISARQWGGMLNVVAILLFLGITIAVVVREKRKGSALPEQTKV